MSKIISRILLLFSLLTVFCLIPVEAKAAESESTPGSAAYAPIIGEADCLITGEDGTLRYVGEDGAEVENAWVIVDENTYYFDNTGRALFSTMRVMDDKTYYFDENGVCKFGLVKIENTTYFFTPLLGINVGWVSSEGEEDIYYFDEDGKMHTGFLEFEREGGGFPVRYYFDEVTGLMHTGWLVLNNSLLYFNEDGEQVFQWYEIDGDWYYFQEFDEGNAARDLWWEKDGERVYLTDSAKMARNEQLTLNGIDIKFDQDGNAHPQWLSGIKYNYIYIIAFLISAFLVYLASAQTDWRESIFAASAVAILTMLAGFRSTSIGLDVSVYITKPIEWIAENGNSITGFMNRYKFMEPGFNLIMYLSGVLFHSPNAAMGFFALLICGFVYAGIRINNGTETRWFGWLVFCFLFYNNSLHIVRQYISVAILFYLFSDSRRITFKKVLIYTALASCFHYASIVSLPAYLLYLVFSNTRVHSTVKMAVQVAACTIPLSAPYLGGSLLNILLEKYPSVFKKYQTFGYGHEANNNFSMDGESLVIALTCLIVFTGFCMYAYLRSNSNKKAIDQAESSGVRFYSTTGIMDAMYSVFSNKFNYRFQYFISIFRLELLLLPLRKMRPVWRRITEGVVLTIVFAYWLHKYVYMNSGQTSPYIFWFE